MADLLFLAHRMPFPAEKGEIRPWQILHHLAERHRVHLGCFYDDRGAVRHIPALEEHCASLACLPLSRLRRRFQRLGALRRGEALSLCDGHDERLMRWIAETLARHRPALAFTCGSIMSSYLDDYRFVRRVVDMADLASETWRDEAERRSSLWRMLYRREARLLLRLEIAAVRSADCALFSSPGAAALFLKRAHHPKARLLALRNGIDHAHFDPARDYPDPYPNGRQRIVLTGEMDDGPDIAAAKWFAAEVMTALRHRFPALDFWIIGARPARAVRALAGRDIHVVGEVEDFRPYLAHADVVVAPRQTARGVQDSMLAAMAMGRPVVATPAALDGLGLKAGEEVLAAANPPQFATAIAQILAGGLPGLGAQARARIVADHGWPSSLALLDPLFADTEPARHSAS